MPFENGTYKGFKATWIRFAINAHVVQETEILGKWRTCCYSGGMHRYDVFVFIQCE